MSTSIYRAVYLYPPLSLDYSFSKWVTADKMQDVRDYLASMDYLASITDINAGENRPPEDDPVIIGWQQMELEADEPE